MRTVFLPFLWRKNVSDILQSLNPVQKEAASCTEGPLLILAGAGSGKTRVLTHRIAYLIEEKGVNPWNIMAITFTNKAAQEMRDRVDRLVEFGAESIWVATFHSSCVRILRRYIDRLGYDNHFTIYDTDDQKSVIRKAVKELDLDPKQYREGPLLGVISAAKNEMIEPQDFETQAGGDFRMCQEAKIYKAYQKTLIDNNAVDFDDLLLLTVRLLRENRDVLEAYQERLRYIMVDEYQDTNSVQFELIRLLSGKYHNLCVVGDDDQSIYKFRGADITNILSFEETFPGAKVVKLEQNYRSTNNILEAANSVIANNAHRKEKHLWSENGEGKEVSFIHYETAYGEAEDVIDKIQTAVHMGKYQYQDCAILYRTNAQSRAFEEKCIKKSVPYRLVGGVNFYQRQEIKDILAYLKTIDSGRDDLSVTRIVNVPKRGIGQVTLNKLAVYASEHGMRLFQALYNLPSTPDCLPQLLADKNVELFTKHHVFTKEELASRYEIKLENYVKTIGIEARTLAEMITKDFLPAVSTYAAEVSKNAAAKKSFMAAADTASEEALVEKLSTAYTALTAEVTELKTLIDTSFALEDTQKCAEAFHDQVLAKMEDIRTIASDIEALIPDSILSYPTYDQLLFSL